MLVLYGCGVLDGSDLATHQMIKDISYVVKLLIEEFGDRFAIKKMISRGDDYEGNYLLRSIRSYWDSSTEMAREEVRQGEVTFEQVMQIEVEEWT
jgi:transketolase C-terminal domain/subunit